MGQATETILGRKKKRKCRAFGRAVINQVFQSWSAVLFSLIERPFEFSIVRTGRYAGPTETNLRGTNSLQPHQPLDRLMKAPTIVTFSFVGADFLASIQHCRRHQQKFRFKNNPDNKGKFMDSGLWGLSRHPNYLGEMGVWWALLGVALPALRCGCSRGICPLVLVPYKLYFTYCCRYHHARWCRCCRCRLDFCLVRTTQERVVP